MRPILVPTRPISPANLVISCYQGTFVHRMLVYKKNQKNILWICCETQLRVKCAYLWIFKSNNAAFAGTALRLIITIPLQYTFVCLSIPAVQPRPYKIFTVLLPPLVAMNTVMFLEISSLKVLQVFLGLLCFLDFQINKNVFSVFDRYRNSKELIHKFMVSILWRWRPCVIIYILYIYICLYVKHIKWRLCFYLDYTLK